MRITNKLGLPQPIVDAVINDDYCRGDAWKSVTGLLKPPRIAALEKLHADELEEEAADNIFRLVGKAVHGILERAERSAISEERLYMEIGGRRISGQMDRFHVVNKHLSDHKVTTVWKVKDGKADDHFE